MPDGLLAGSSSSSSSVGARGSGPALRRLEAQEECLDRASGDSESSHPEVWTVGDMLGAVESFIEEMVGYHAAWVEAEKCELGQVQVDEILGGAQAEALQRMQTISSCDMEALREYEQVRRDAWRKICAVQAAEGEVVLQTYTVPLQAVRKDLEAWKASMEEEYRALVDKTKVVRPISEGELASVPGYKEAEYAPSKLVTTVQAPNGRRRARAVICGNLVASLNGSTEKEPGDEPSTYAGGVDGTALRSVFRKAAHEGFTIGTVDVKTAFLLAPRQEGRKLLITRPPRVMVEAGVRRSDEYWLVDGAMYGLDSSRSDWAAFRDHAMSGFRWSENGKTFKLVRTPEQNIWAICEAERSGRRIGRKTDRWAMWSPMWTTSWWQPARGRSRRS